MGDTPPPHCRILVRSKVGVELYTIPERPDDPTPPPQSRSDPFLIKGSTTFQKIAPDGSAVYVHVVERGVFKLPLGREEEDAHQSMIEPFLNPSRGVQMLDVSPKGSFLVTWERYHAETCPFNLKVWEAKTGQLLAAFLQKNLQRASWPYLYWMPEEDYAFLLSGTGEVRVYPATAFRCPPPEGDAAAAGGGGGTAAAGVRYTSKLVIPGMTIMNFPRQRHPSTTVVGGSSSFSFTSFAPGSKSMPAKVSMHVYNPSATTGTVPANPYPSILSKSLFQADEMKCQWSPQGDAALITLQTAIDASGQSYYGSSQLFLMTHGHPQVITVPLTSAPVLDVAWMPDPTKPPCFVTIAGKMPTMATLHHGVTGQPLFQFGQAHRNTISWAPHGRFLCLAGFGNLAGGFTFWDRNKAKPIPHIPANVQGLLRAKHVPTSYGWSPSSRVFMTATCTPRMNVGNGITLYNYAGQEFDRSSVPWINTQYEPDQLWQVEFVPVPPGTYSDRPQSPPPAATAAAASSLSSSSTTGTTVDAAKLGMNDSSESSTVKVSKAYVPPSARNRTAGSGMSLAERLRREKESSLQPAQKVNNATVSSNSATTSNPSGGSGRTVVGLMTTATEGKSKSAQRREKAKQKKQAVTLLEQQLSSVVNATNTDPSNPPFANEMGTAAAVTTADTPTNDDPEKRVRKLRKTWKQIQELKAKTDLNDDQKKKIAAEAEVRAELEQLGVSDL